MKVIKTMKNPTKEDRRGGCYFVEGKPYPSVTHILGDVLKKPAIEYWKCKQMWLTMVKEPTQSMEQAMSSMYGVSDRAKTRGTAVHSIVEAWKVNDIKIETTPELQPFADAFYQWLRDTNPKKLESEKTIINYKEGYAGTLDLLVEIDGQKAVVDVKTSKDGETYRDAFLQVSAYLGALSDVKRGFVLGLGENGKYTFKEVDPSIDAFLACKKIYEYLNHDELEKLGYYQPKML